MKIFRNFSRLLLCPIVLLFLSLPARAVTLWTGPSIGFTQTVASAASADVLIPGSVSLTRDGNHWLYNTNFETFADDGSPKKTLWAFGALSNYTTLAYATFDSYRNTDLEGVLTNGGPMVLRIQLTSDTNNDIYVFVRFTAWPHGGGAFSYIRSTPGVVVPPSPTVSITNPVDNAVFAAPANVKIEANASVSSGSVTNVQFFAGTTLLASDQTPPFSIIASNLAATNYVLTAIAYAGGASTISSPAHISVVSAVPIVLSSPQPGGGQFSFNYTANTGLSYVVETSAALPTWFPIITNVAVSNPVHFSKAFVSNGPHFFRVGRLPNP